MNRKKVSKNSNPTIDYNEVVTPLGVNLSADVYKVLPTNVQDELKRLSVTLEQHKNMSTTLMSDLKKEKAKYDQAFSSLHATGTLHTPKGDHVTLSLSDGKKEFIFGTDDNELYTIRYNDKQIEVSTESTIGISLESVNKVAIFTK